MIDPDEANETYKTASAIAAFQLTQLAFAALVKKEILPKAEAEQILRQAIETKIRADMIFGKDRAGPCHHAQARAHDGRRRDGGKRAGQRLGLHGALAGGAPS